jgi:thiol-disulfide isomerase/thioredoxin
MFGEMFSQKDKKPASNETEISVRSPDQVEQLENLVLSGPVTFILVHADWCGPCQRYKPQWKELSDIPGLKTNVAMIHHDMVEKSAMLKNAKIPGYPSVLKVFPNGHIETYKDDDNKSTNAMPNIRDSEIMKKELMSIPVLNLGVNQNSSKKLNKPKSLMNELLGNNTNKNTNSKSLNSGTILPVSRYTKRNVANSLIKNSGSEVTIGATKPMKGGNLYLALSAALKAAAPTATLLFANEVLRSRKQNVIPPKKNHGSTKRLTRKSKRASKKAI